ncbi:hypothetical protein GOP47_0004591 [Adiantum capillus-veneris]|uniref:Uncharacterized protein n=1 Tax=Adiantum capillus-veneris TaxID=13818 RepID=A0A9D4V954_ADICA|nr:hypothetical protein GOP47_0004591 [Adiantum capillus-veneris]
MLVPCWHALVVACHVGDIARRAHRILLYQFAFIFLSFFHSFFSSLGKKKHVYKALPACVLGRARIVVEKEIYNKEKQARKRNRKRSYTHWIEDLEKKTDTFVQFEYWSLKETCYRNFLARKQTSIHY